jgi:hypothetical protein
MCKHRFSDRSHRSIARYCTKIILSFFLIYLQPCYKKLHSLQLHFQENYLFTYNAGEEDQNQKEQ